ncbi:MAG TPA: imidazoleglycerol-phosphate dehydratase HisB [Clostridiaceae bacterium]|jgi:imidazoleglycerol-phosphate dehydratase|nr:imidazoleglycerol-phosphate dehydratase HisB [Clostridiaceae bacterium]
MERKANIKRKTNETDISLNLAVDGDGKSEINTGIGFLDHMLTLFAKHGFFDLYVEASGDLEVDGHHTVEDVGIVLGQAIKNALGEKKSIKRYGTSFVPMDETLAMVSIDLSGRPFLIFDANFSSPGIGNLDTQLIEEFFRAVAFSSGITLHIKILHGKNDHHKAEAIFKAFGRALDDAVKPDIRITGVMSTKGIL